MVYASPLEIFILELGSLGKQAFKLYGPQLS